MRAVEPRAGDVPQHALEAACPPSILRLLLLRPRSPFIAWLRMGDERDRNDPCRGGGEDQFPYGGSRKTVRHPLI
jgi:hypothetical protein